MSVSLYILRVNESFLIRSSSEKKLSWTRLLVKYNNVREETNFEGIKDYWKGLKKMYLTNNESEKCG